MRVYKYNFEPSDIVTVRLPPKATILHCGYQDTGWRMWALVDDTSTSRPENRNVRMAGTGHKIDSMDIGRFINTDISHDGMLVFHFFETP